MIFSFGLVSTGCVELQANSAAAITAVEIILIRIVVQLIELTKYTANNSELKQGVSV